MLKSLMMKKNVKGQINTKKIKKKNRKNPLVILLSLICIVAAVFLCVQLFSMKMLPLMLEIPAIVIILVLSLLLFLFYNFLSRRPISRFISAFLILGLTIAYGIGNYYIYKTTEMFSSVTNLTENLTNTISVVTLTESGYTTLESLNGMTIGTITSQDEEGTQKAEDDISNKISYDTLDYTTFEDLYYAFYTDEVQAIILNESFRGIVFEMDENANNQTMIVNQTKYYTKRSSSENTARDAVNVVSKPFTILISGNDSFGGLTSNSRSDSNMLLTINPNTHTVLMTSVPRDYYEVISCGSKDSGLACPEGERDKLTHSGIYGIDTTEKTIENFLDITINYNVRVNFSSLTNLVDALGGIDVYVEEGLAVDRFNADWSLQGVSEGWNHLDGKRALAFARERYAYTDGDAQRVKNQQIVIEAMINKIASPSMIGNFGNFMDALSGVFETNMTSDEILSLVRYEFTFFPEWKFESYALVGSTSNAYCPTLGDYADVMLANLDSIQVAHDKIQAVLNGESSTTVSDTIDENNIEVIDDSQNQVTQDPGYYYDPYAGYDYSQDYTTDYYVEDPSQYYTDDVYNDSYTDDGIYSEDVYYEDQYTY